MPESLRVEEDAYGTRYLGCGAALSLAGIVRSEQLPGENGPRKRSAVYYDGIAASRGRSYPRDEKYMEVKMVGRDRFSVWIPTSKARREVQATAEERTQQIAADRASASAELARLPSSREAYRASCLDCVNSFLGAVLFHIEATDRHGYSFDFNTVQEVKAASARLLAALQGGGVAVDSSHHARKVAELRERAGLPPERPRLRLVTGDSGVVNAS